MEPLRLEHVEDLAAIGVGHDIFRWFPFAVDTKEDMLTYVRTGLAAQEAGTALPFVTIELASGRIAGATSLLAIERTHRRLEIGATWLGEAFQRTACNTEAKFLQLRHCFEDLGCVRVEFKTDALNAPSRAALARIGAVEEGTFRNHLICPGGRLRHSVYYSIIDSEWPAIKHHLQQLLVGRGRGAASPDGA